MFTALLAAALALPPVQPSQGAQQLRLIDTGKSSGAVASPSNVLDAWLACADAVEGRNLWVDQTTLLSSGWQRSAFVVGGKVVSDAEMPMYSRPGNSAVILLSGKTCTVSAMMADEATAESIKPQIAQRVKQVADKRNASFSRSNNEVGQQFFTSRGFNVSLRFRDVAPLPGVSDPTRVMVSVQTVDIVGKSK